MSPYYLMVAVILMQSAEAGSWMDSARRFTGESEEVRKQSIAELKKRTELRSELKKALGTRDHFLALDVISVLELRSMLPELIAFSARDQTGYSYHAINSLITNDRLESIQQIYMERLFSKKTSAAGKTAIIDSLSRLNVSLKEDQIKNLLNDSSPEVRSSLLNLIRTELIYRNVQRNLDYLDQTIADPSFQLRTQTLYLVSELPLKLKRSNLIRINGLLDQCAHDPVTSVRALCESVRKGSVDE